MFECHVKEIRGVESLTVIVNKEVADRPTEARPMKLIIQTRPCANSQCMLESLWGWSYGPN